MKKLFLGSGASYEAPPADSQLWNRGFCLIILMACCVNFGNYIVGSSFSLWVIDMGGTNTIYGTIHSLFSIVILLARPITGWIIDHGNRKVAFVASSLLFAATMVAMLYSKIFALFVAMRLIQGIGNGCALTICNTSAYDFMPASKMDKGIGYMTLSSSLISAFTATLSVGQYNKNGPSGIVLWSVIAMCIGIVLSLPLVFRKPKEEKKFSLKEIFNPSALFEKQALQPALLIALSVNLAFGLRSYIMLYGRSLGFANPGWFTTISAIGLLLVRFALDLIPRREGSSKRRIYIAYAVFCAYLIVLSQCKNFTMFCIAAVMWSIVYGVLSPELQSIAIKKIPQERRGAAASTFFCATDIGVILGSYFGGVIADNFGGYRTMFAVALIPVILCIIYFTIFMRKKVED